jgi:salicylate hydroxylase
VLSHCLRDVSAQTVGDALLNYQDIRLERATRIQQLSRRRPKQNHLPDGDEQRKRDNEFVHRDQWNEHAWIYGHDAGDWAKTA